MNSNNNFWINSQLIQSVVVGFFASTFRVGQAAVVASVSIAVEMSWDCVLMSRAASPVNESVFVCADSFFLLFLN